MDFANDGVADAPPDGDSLAVVRDALLSQLQQDRRRKDIIVAELAKIERAMALPDASPSATAWHGAAAAGKAAATEMTQPKKPSPSEKSETAVRNPMPPSAWSCAVCQVRTTSERNLRDHCGVQKHQAKVAALEKTTKTMACQKAKPKTYTSRWSCSICNVSCTGEWDFDVHLKGQRNQANTQALLEQSKKNSGSSEPHGTKAQAQQRNVSQHAEKKVAAWICRDCQARRRRRRRRRKKKEEEEEATWICRACQAHCTCESDLQNHLMGKRHQLNVQKGVTSDGSSFTSATSEMMDEQKALYFCKVCSLKCTSERMLAYHLSGKKHLKQEKLQAFCEICKLQCNSEKMLADHRCGKKHQAKLKKVLQAKFNAMECNVSDLAF